jgi:hypothetical protein
MRSERKNKYMCTEVKIYPWYCISSAIKFSWCHVHAGARKQVDSLYRELRSRKRVFQSVTRRKGSCTLEKENQHCTGLFELKVNWSLCIGTNKLINLFNHKGGAKGINILSVVRHTAARGDPQQIDFLGY